MLHTDLLVDIPTSKIRIKKQNNNEYVYLLEGRKGDSQGHEKDISINIGKKVSDGKMHPNDEYLKRHPEFSAQPSSEPPKFDSQSKIGASLAISRLAEELSLTSCLKSCFDDRADLILSLITYYTISRDSAAMLYEDFMFDHYGIIHDIASEATISRLFNQDMTSDKLDKFRSMWLAHHIANQKRDKDGNRPIHFYVDIDSTNINSAGRKCEMTEFGKAKADEDLKQVNFAYFYDRASGMPIFYDTYYGSINDIAHLRNGLDIFTANLGVEVRDLNLEFILDRGYFSEVNVRHIEKHGYSFAIMGKDGVVFSDLVRNYGDRVRSTENFMETGRYGLRIRGKGFNTKKSNDYYLYLYYDQQKATEERIGLETKIMQAKKAIEGKKKDTNGGLKRTYHDYLDIVEDEKHNIISWKINSAVLDEKLAQCGFFWIVSNMEKSCEEIITAYKQRDEIEKSFRYVKSEGDLNKTYAQSDNSLKAKVFMGFLVSIIRGEMIHRTREIVRQKSNLSLQKIILALDKIIIFRQGKMYYQKYALTALQQQINKKFQVKKTDIEKVVKTTAKILCKNDMVV